jgi:WXG100 family type VII secretion target
MSDATVKYDYAVLEECLSMMKSKASEIQNQADELETDVKKIMVDWQGSTAERYNQLANDLDNDLVANRANLDSLTKALQQASESMQEQDSSGARRMQG